MAGAGEQVKPEHAELEATEIPVSAFADRLGEYMDRAYDGEDLAVTRNGRKRAFVVGPRAYADLEEFRRRKREQLARREQRARSA